MSLWNLFNDGSFAGRLERAPEPRGVFAPCKWCGNCTDRLSRKCDDCLRDLHNDHLIDQARGK